MIREDRLPAAAGQQIVLHSHQFLRIFLISPQEDAGRSGPENRKRLRCLEYMGSVRKLFAVPEIAAGLVQHAQWNMGIEIEGRSLVILTVDNDEIAGTILFLNGNRQIVRRQNWRESRERDMHAGQQANH